MSTRDLFALIKAMALAGDPAATILDEEHRHQHATARAEHFFYPHLEHMLSRYRQNITAEISDRTKIIARREGREIFDLEWDKEELFPRSDIGTGSPAPRRRYSTQ